MVVRGNVTNVLQKAPGNQVAHASVAFAKESLDLRKDDGKLLSRLSLKPMDGVLCERPGRDVNRDVVGLPVRHEVSPGILEARSRYAQRRNRHAVGIVRSLRLLPGLDDLHSQSASGNVTCRLRLVVHRFRSLHSFLL